MTYFSKEIVDNYIAEKFVNLESYVKLRRYVDIMYDVQDVRMRTANRERGLPKEVEGLHSTRLSDVEKGLEKDVKDILKLVPETKVFEGIRGCGPRLIGSWISNVMIRYDAVEEADLDQYSDVQQQFKIKTKGTLFRVPSIRGIVAFATVSNMWSWCGLRPGTRRVKGIGWVDEQGEEVKINPAMRVLAWKNAGQFVRQGDFYRKVYEVHKEWYNKSSRYAAALINPEHCPRYQACSKSLRGAATRLKRAAKKPACKGHIDRMARRRMIKDFVRDTYVRWLTLDGLPVPPPYDPDHRHHDKA